MRNFDVIIVGLGAMGSAAADHLTRRGYRVLGLDQHRRGHGYGASHGKSRFIREAYFERPEYVSLVQRAYGQWRDLEARTGRKLLEITGGLWMGPPGSRIVEGSLESARRHGLAHELLDAAEIGRRYGFVVGEQVSGLLEPNAGVLQPEDCVAAQLDEALRRGARLRHGERVVRWQADGEGVRVETDEMTFTAEKLVLAAGPWAAKVLGELRVPIEASLVHYAHFEPAGDPARFARLPLYLVDWEPGVYYYGVPYRAGEGLKFGLHKAVAACDPDEVDRAVPAEVVDLFRARLNQLLPGSAERLLWAESCLYAMTPDTDFIVDVHPAHQGRVCFGGGFSGHGFKFAPVIGEILADFAEKGRTEKPVEFLRLARETIRV